MQTESYTRHLGIAHMEAIEEFLDASTSIEWLILADSAEVVGGKLYLMGGGWDRLTVHSQPAKKNLAVALALRVPWHETNRQHAFRIDMTDEDGSQIVSVNGATEVGRPAGIPPGQPQLVQLVVNFDATLKRLGTYVITARVNDSQERSVRFNIVPGPSVSRQSD